VEWRATVAEHLAEKIHLRWIGLQRMRCDGLQRMWLQLDWLDAVKFRLLMQLVKLNLLEYLDLLRPIYSLTSAYGHFGRELPEFAWERTNRVSELQNAIK
jgi:hypothetical protein